MQGILDTVLKKLSNEKFVGQAPKNVLEMEQKKKADAEAKIKSLQEHIAGLK
jgi:valyl-tRNA synthetase